LKRDQAAYDFERYFCLVGAKMQGHSEQSEFEILEQNQDIAGFMRTGTEYVGGVYRQSLRTTDWVQEVLQDVRTVLDLRGNDYVAVHSRYSDMRWTPSHPTPPNPGQVLDASVQEARRLGDKTIFISADNQKVIRNFQQSQNEGLEVLSLNYYSGKFADILRGDPNLSVLIEALILSESASFVHSVSSVSFAARVLRSDSNWTRVSFDCGTNSSRLPLAVLNVYRRSLMGAIGKSKCEVSIYDSK